MMRREDFFELGYISKAHGYKGEVYFLIKESLHFELTLMESVFIEINGQLIPFFIDDCRETGNSSWIVKLHDVDTEEKTKRLIKCTILLPSSHMPKQKKRNIQPEGLIGYTVVDDTKGDIGKVSKILEMPQQLILEIQYGSKEILIPANEQIIYKVDKKNKIIYLDAPEGLIDIYLGEKD